MRIGDYPLFDRAARYFPLRRLLCRHVGDVARVLEIGSGPFGIGWFLRRGFVGCDVRFELPPSPPMQAVAASATHLPFRNGAFDAAVVSDVLEHLPAAARLEVVREALRVTGRLALFGFPAGRAAGTLDEELAREYERRGRAPPPWLREHLVQDFPDERLFDAVGPGWTVRVAGNESLGFHRWMMRCQLRFAWRALFRAALVLARPLVEGALRLADAAPCYRRIVAVIAVPATTTRA